MLQVAQLVGYKHNSSLTKKFKKLENITPNEFRKISRK
ncbi:AraC family transcriptional regulator [Clostridium sp. DL1XJH146]